MCMCMFLSAAPSFLLPGTPAHRTKHAIGFVVVELEVVEIEVVTTEVTEALQLLAGLDVVTDRILEHVLGQQCLALLAQQESYQLHRIVLASSRGIYA